MFGFGEDVDVLDELFEVLDALLADVSRGTPAPWLTESRLLGVLGAAGVVVGLAGLAGVIVLDGLLGVMRFTSPVELLVVELLVSLRFMERMVEPSLWTRMRCVDVAPAVSLAVVCAATVETPAKTAERLRPSAQRVRNRVVIRSS